MYVKMLESDKKVFWEFINFEQVSELSEMLSWFWYFIYIIRFNLNYV